MKITSVFTVALLVFSGFSAQAAVGSQEKTYKMRWVLAHAPVRVFDRAARHFTEEVKKNTDGKVQIEIVTGASMNGGKMMSADQAYELVKTGQVEMTQTYTTYLGNHNAAFWALDLPFIFRDHQHAAKVLEGPVGEKILSGLQANNVSGLAFTYSGGYMIIPTVKQEIRSVDDLKGLRVRVNNNSPVGTAFLKSLGATPMPTQAEYSGDMDGFESTYARFVDLGADVQNNMKVINDLQHSLFLTAILINKSYFESLPVKYQQAIQTAARTAAKLEREDSIRDSETAKSKYQQEGVKIVAMEGKQLQRMKDYAPSIYRKFEPVVGKDIIKSIQAL